VYIVHSIPSDHRLFFPQIIREVRIDSRYPVKSILLRDFYRTHAAKIISTVRTTHNKTVWFLRSMDVRQMCLFVCAYAVPYAYSAGCYQHNARQASLSGGVIASQFEGRVYGQGPSRHLSRRSLCASGRLLRILVIVLRLICVHLRP
jgi:hypothetical protein